MSARVLIVLGLILAAAGVFGLVAGGVPYDDEETLIDAGPVQASASVEREWQVPPLLAGGVLALGGILITVGVVRRP